MRKGLLCSWSRHVLAFLVGPALVSVPLAQPVLAQQPSYYYQGWPSASPGAVQGYGYYQAPTGNSGYNYQQYPQQYSYQNSYYQCPYQSAYQNWYSQGQQRQTQQPYASWGYGDGAYGNAQGYVAANQAPSAPPATISEGAGQYLDPNQPMMSTPVVAPFPGLGNLGLDPAELARPPEAPIESIARTSVKDDCFWIGIDYIAAWTKHMPTPPLVTTGFAGDLPAPGALGEPTTQVLFGGHPLAFGNPASGMHAEAGIWLDQDNRFSLDVGGFFLPRTFNRFALQSDANGNPTITRPVINASTGAEEVLIDALPGVPAQFLPAVASGGTSISASQELWGFETNARYHAFLGRYLHAEGLMGFRYLQLNEDLSIRDNTTGFSNGAFSFLGNPVPAGVQITDFDYFKTTNQFMGFQLGGRLRWDFGRYFFDLTGKAAVGANQETVFINGATSVAGVTAPGGVLALPSNMGNHNTTSVCFVPELGINAGVNLTRWCRLHAGYNFLFMSSVVRPGDEVSRTINPNQLPTDPGFGLTAGPPQPLFAFHQSDFWVQYFNLGVELHY